jgi:hypothetical protein
LLLNIGWNHVEQHTSTGNRCRRQLFHYSSWVAGICQSNISFYISCVRLKLFHQKKTIRMRTQQPASNFKLPHENHPFLAKWSQNTSAFLTFRWEHLVTVTVVMMDVMDVMSWGPAVPAWRWPAVSARHGSTGSTCHELVRHLGCRGQ